jgi:hypothetical protein
MSYVQEVVPLPSVNDAAEYAFRRVDAIYDTPINEIYDTVEMYPVQLAKELADAFNAGYQLGKGNS